MYQNQISVENINWYNNKMKKEISALRKENKQLRTKLTKITRELMDILGIEEKYPEEFLTGETVFEGSFDNQWLKHNYTERYRGGCVND